MEKQYLVDRSTVKFEKSIGTVPASFIINDLSKCLFKIELGSKAPVDIEFVFFAGNEAKRLPLIKGINSHISYPFIVPDDFEGVTFNGLELKCESLENLHLSIYTEIDENGGFAN
jgi:hypothetical protein